MILIGIIISILSASVFMVPVFGILDWLLTTVEIGLIGPGLVVFWIFFMLILTVASIVFCLVTFWDWYTSRIVN
jgi:hypothetical protein